MHILIAGRTGSGKTTLALALARRYHDEGYPVLVLDPILDPRWRAVGDDVWTTADTSEFVSAADSSRGCLLVVDEAGELMGRDRAALPLVRQATRGRHRGHLLILISQGLTSIHHSARAQCSSYALFSLTPTEAAKAESETGVAECAALPEARPGEYLWIRPFAPAERLRAFGSDGAG